MDFIFKVDPIRRNIKVPDGFTVLTMDHNVHKLVFVCPYYEDFAFDSASIVFMVDAPDGGHYIIPAEEYESFPNSPAPYVRFTLTLKSYITSVVGYMSFCITADIISSGNVIEKSWHSKNISISVGGHIDNDDSEDIPEEDVPTINQRLNNLDSKVGRLQTTVNGMANGSPTPVSTVAEMTEHDKVYLYTGLEPNYTAGNWYFWNGSAWTSGGTYGGAVTDTTLSISGKAADAKAVGDAIDGLDDRVTALESGSSGGLTADIKSALLACFANVAWEGTDGQNFYDALESALNPPVNLSSITCVYTQSGTVYDTASLDDLKTDLVVTAHWSDNTTSTITTYTLSGTLTAGTSTITVSYSGKTTTFTVTVLEAVPSTYTKHGYIKLLSTSDKGRTSVPKARWIELRKYDNLNAISCEIEAQSDSLYTGTRPAMMGRRSASGYASSFAFYAASNSSILGGHLHGTEINQGPSFLQDTRNIIKYTNTSASPSSLKVNDREAVSVAWANNDTLNLAPVLFGNPVNDTNTDLSGSHRIGYIKIFDLSGDMIGYYIPVVRVADNVIGMYEVVTQTFYTASTSSYATIGDSNCIYQVGEWS